jgi:hypothetical protein
MLNIVGFGISGYGTLLLSVTSRVVVLRVNVRLFRKNVGAR